MKCILESPVPVSADAKSVEASPWYGWTRPCRWCRGRLIRSERRGGVRYAAVAHEESCNALRGKAATGVQSKRSGGRKSRAARSSLEA